MRVGRNVGRVCAGALNLGICWLLASPAFATGVCFTAADKPAFPMIMQAPPPNTDNAVDYAFYPATAAATMKAPAIESSRSREIKGIYWQWANHGPRAADRGAKGNITPGSPGVQIRFSSKAAANACTMAQTAVAIGRSPGPYLNRGRLSSGASPVASDTLDVCVLPAKALPPSTPILLDYEVADGRTSNETSEFLVNWAQLVRQAGHRSILYVNPLDAPSQRLTQMTVDNAPVVANAFDQVGVFLWSGNVERDILRSFEVQSAMYRAPPSKLMIVFELNHTTLADARVVHTLMTSGRAGSLNIWRNYATQGGGCETDANRKIACAAFGRCS